MDPSSVLCPLSQNRIRRDIMRSMNEHNKIPAHPKPSKQFSTPHLSNQNIEIQDPGISETGRKAPVQPGVSRLPVLARSLRFQTPSDFSQSHCRWEEKLLSGKTKNKRPCTRPIPFNLSQPKKSRVATENHQPLSVSQSRTGTHAVQPDNNVCNARIKTQNINAKPIKPPATLNRNVDSTTGTSNEKVRENTHRQISGQFGPSNTFKTSAISDNPLSHIPNNAMHPTINSVSDKGENFQSDHAALLSILRNEGVRVTDVGCATPQSNSYNYLLMHVDHNCALCALLTGSIRLVQFSPDPAALQSILQNEGVKGGGPAGSTPRNSTCPPGRGTSIYTDHQVRSIAVKVTPLKTWTPQRVRDTRHQPMSALVSVHVLYFLSGYLKYFVKSLYAVWCRPSLLQTKSHCEEKVEESRVGDNEVEEDQQSIVGGQPFFQAPQRESVIFFSTGKTLLRAPRFKKQEDSARHEQHGPVLQAEKEVSPVSVLPCEINPPVQSLTSHNNELYYSILTMILLVLRIQ
uniref:Uncharacterized protein n=1 Tax=Cyclopterus lumpus TaxID=8103 RepID=A0A8C2ZS51_CYCLU